jgi:hypothetical protein
MRERRFPSHAKAYITNHGTNFSFILQQVINNAFNTEVIYHWKVAYIREDVQGSNCCLIKVLSWHLVGGIQKTNEKPQDSQCPAMI